uniref:Thioredoxin-like fold domain-containing protein n=1 Tax=Magnetococcus massalia (strain MO-1) TaxID=451514 RepID=A0A1S7LL06_MAGMO|nr:Conserved protein of unknown function. putative thioredoxin-related protein-like protein [Candidatus Magnetococcus massalia]
MRIKTAFLAALWVMVWLPFVAPSAVQAAQPQLTLVLFVQPACPWCDKLEKDLANNPDFMRYLNTQFRMETVDIRDKEPLKAFAGKSGKELSKQYRVRITPTTVLLKDGEKFGRIPGYIEPKDYRDVVKQYMEQAGL